MKRKYKIVRPAALLCAFVALLLTGCNEKETYVDEDTSAVVKIQALGDLETNQITVQIEPNEQAQSYIYMIGQDADLEAFKEGSHQAIYKVLSGEPTTHTFTYLKPHTTYTIFARAVDKKSRLGAVASLKITTMTDDFAIGEEYIGTQSVGVYVIHSGDYYGYDYAIGKAEDKEAFVSGTLSTMERIQEKPRFIVNFFGLDPETEYTVFVRGYDRQDVPTKVFELPVQTRSAATYPAILAHDFRVVDLFYADCQLTLNDATHKAAVLIKPRILFDDILNDQTNGDMMTYIHQKAEVRDTNGFDRGPKMQAMSLTRELVMIPEPFDIPYDAYVLLYDQERRPFAVERLTYVTPEYDPNLPKPGIRIEMVQMTEDGFIVDLHREDAIGALIGFYTAKVIDDAKESGADIDALMIRNLSDKFAYAFDGEPIRKQLIGVPKGMEICMVVIPVNRNGIKHGLGDVIYHRVTL